MVDPKIEFNGRAVVYDDGWFYQWKIADSYNITTKSSWWESNLFDLLPLWEIHQEIFDLRTQDGVYDKSKEEVIRKKYEELEKLRTPIRNQIWEYHKKKREKYESYKIYTPDPPRISMFESLRLVHTEEAGTIKAKYDVRSHLEPLFYRAALRNLRRAIEVANNNQQEDNDLLILDEIEHSMVAITSAVGCLEAYINYILQEHYPKYYSEAHRMSVKQKWLFVPNLLGVGHEFSPDRTLFMEFSQIVKWRNNAVHHRSGYFAAQGDKTRIYNQFNTKNARLAVDTTQAMIKLLSQNTSLRLPNWLIRPERTHGGWWEVFEDESS